MSLQDDISSIVSQPESTTLEFKAVLPPSRSMAQMLCAFANSEGGYLVLGVNESDPNSRLSGLSKDFHANAVTQRAISLLSPRINMSSLKERRSL
jgi:predicted HTH transcriptional regulator